MKTRSGLCYPRGTESEKKVTSETILKRTEEKEKEREKERERERERDLFSSRNEEMVFCPKRRRLLKGENNKNNDLFDSLPDDLIVSILSKLSAKASCPSDFISVLLTCKRLKELGLSAPVVSKASVKVFAVKAKNWCDAFHRFVRLCATFGNAEACYTLGMIKFYCLQNRGSGASLMAKAAMNSQAQALYSLAVIQFNGSGGTKNDKDLRAGVALCARAAFLGHVDAMRELGHCLQDGYGVRQNIAEGRRFIVQANARELASVFSTPNAAYLLCTRSLLMWPLHNNQQQQGQDPDHVSSTPYPLLSDYGWNVPAPEPHPANRFLVEWFALRGGSPGPGLRLCSHVGCGRPETRRHEFRRCSVCGVVNYCSRACQALDWKLRHKGECTPVERWVDEDGVGENDGVNDGNDDVMIVAL